MESRANSFKVTNLSKETTLKLSKCGFYYDGGIKCIYCNFVLKTYRSYTDVLLLHEEQSPGCGCYDVCGNGVISTLYFEKYESRMESFQTWASDISAVSLCTAGFFYTQENDLVQCFSCHVKINEWKNDDIPFVEHLKFSNCCEFALECMIHYENRLATLVNFRNAESLAFAGFYNNGNFLITCCCDKKIDYIQDNVNALELHKKLSKKCTYIKYMPKIPVDLRGTLKNRVDDIDRCVKEGLYYDNFSKYFILGCCFVNLDLNDVNKCNFKHSSNCIKNEKTTQ